MTLRKPLFINSSAGAGWHEEMAAGDSAAFGALSLTGNIDMTSTGKVVNLVAATTSGDALSYAQSGASLAGLATTANITMASNKVTGLAAATTSGDAASYGQSGLSLAGLTLTAALAMGSNAITGLLDPTNPQDGATKNYVDLKLQGITWKQPVIVVGTSNLTLSGEQTIDGVLTSASRILLTAQSTASQNGIYVTAAGAWTRATDLAATVHAADVAVFVEQGTSFADTAWVCTSDPPNDIVATNSLAFIQFTSSGVTTASTGLTKVGNDIRSVTANAAGTFVNGSNQIAIKVTATNPGVSILADGIQTLQDANGGLTHGSSGDKILLQTNPSLQLGATGLAFLPDPNGGLQNGAAGASVKIATANNLSEAAAGLDVVGVPSLFKINGSATSANVTAANLGTLTAGAASDASSLHTHSNLGTGITASYTALNALAIADAVYWSATNDNVDKAQANTDAKAWVVGINKTAVSSGATATIISAGVAAGVLSSATAGTPYYLQATGGIGTALVGSGGNRVVLVGFAKNATDLFVSIRDFGKKI